MLTASKASSATAATAATKGLKKAKKQSKGVEEGARGMEKRKDQGGENDKAAASVSEVMTEHQY